MELNGRTSPRCCAATAPAPAPPAPAAATTASWTAPGNPAASRLRLRRVSRNATTGRIMTTRDPSFGAYDCCRGLVGFGLQNWLSCALCEMAGAVLLPALSLTR
jgi:hypothetical protein